MRRKETKKRYRSSDKESRGKIALEGKGSETITLSEPRAFSVSTTRPNNNDSFDFTTTATYEDLNPTTYTLEESKEEE